MKPLFFNNINLGITSKCNAGCAYCNRKTFPEFPDKNRDMSMETFMKVLPYTKHIQFCGSYGDFINHKESLPFAWITKKQGTHFYIETNAGIHSKEYWRDLASICDSENCRVQFSIDDIKNDINPYRKVKTEKVLENLNYFIEAGGYAYVKSILFAFNEDQQDEMKEYFAKIGVKKFLNQYSIAYEGDLAAPKNCPYEKGTLPYLYDVNAGIKQPVKRCMWLQGAWLYILDNGEVHPCCNIVPYGATMKDLLPHIGHMTNMEQYGEVYDIYLRNKELINLNYENVTLESAWNNEYLVYVRENFQNIKRCHSVCAIHNFMNETITGLVDDVERY